MSTQPGDHHHDRPTVKRNDRRSRYELVRDAEIIGIADYRVEGRSVVMPHTMISPEHRGQGHGEHLVREALLDVRRSGRTVVPTCWFVAEFVELNPEFGDLVAT